MKQSVVSVVYLDGTFGEVSIDVLDVLIATGRIGRFKRKAGWVDVHRERDSLRDYLQGKRYVGPERRSPWPDKQQDAG